MNKNPDTDISIIVFLSAIIHFFAEILGNGKKHENTRLSNLKFFLNKKKLIPALPTQ